MEHVFAGDEGRASRGADGLAVMPVEDDTVPGEFVNVGCGRLEVARGIAEIGVALLTRPTLLIYFLGFSTN